jgi:hypothetical protein
VCRSNLVIPSFMLALARKFSRTQPLRFAAIFVVGAALSSCANKEEPQLVSTGAGQESQLPWNQQQKWEQQGQFGPMAERFQTR